MIIFDDFIQTCVRQTYFFLYLFKLPNIIITIDEIIFPATQRAVLLRGLQNQRQAGGLLRLLQSLQNTQKIDLPLRCRTAAVPILQKARFQIQRKRCHAEGARRINGDICKGVKRI